MADEEVKNPQGGDDGFPSFLTAPVENENEEYEYEYSGNCRENKFCQSVVFGTFLQETYRNVIVPIPDE